LLFPLASTPGGGQTTVGQPGFSPHTGMPGSARKVGVPLRVLPVRALLHDRITNGRLNPDLAQSPSA